MVPTRWLSNSNGRGLVWAIVVGGILLLSLVGLSNPASAEEPFVVWPPEQYQVGEPGEEILIWFSIFNREDFDDEYEIELVSDVPPGWDHSIEPDTIEILAWEWDSFEVILDIASNATSDEAEEFEFEITSIETEETQEFYVYVEVIPPLPDLALFKDELAIEPDLEEEGAYNISVMVHNLAETDTLAWVSYYELNREIGIEFDEDEYYFDGEFLVEEELIFLPGNSSKKNWTLWWPENDIEDSLLMVQVEPWFDRDQNWSNNVISNREVDLHLAETDVTIRTQSDEEVTTFNISAEVHNAGDLNASAWIEFVIETPDIVEELVEYREIIVPSSGSAIAYAHSGGLPDEEWWFEDDNYEYGLFPFGLFDIEAPFNLTVRIVDVYPIPDSDISNNEVSVYYNGTEGKVDFSISGLSN